MAYARSYDMNSTWHISELMTWYLGTVLWLPHETSTSINCLIFLYEVIYIYIYIYICIIPFLLSKQKIAY